jgi:MFS family permease
MRDDFAQILTIIADAGSSGLLKIYAGRVISGFGIGAISAIAPAYVSECSPKDVRGRMTGLFQVMAATGVMLSYFINRPIFPFIQSNPSRSHEPCSRRGTVLPS